MELLQKTCKRQTLDRTLPVGHNRVAINKLTEMGFLTYKSQLAICLIYWPNNNTNYIIFCVIILDLGDRNE